MPFEHALKLNFKKKISRYLEGKGFFYAENYYSVKKGQIKKILMIRVI